MTDPDLNTPPPPVRHDSAGQGHVRPTQTRGASKEGVVRWVLIASMALIIAGMLVIWLTGVAST